MAQFVRVSGYGSDALEQAKREGMKQFIDDSSYFVYDGYQGNIPSSTGFTVFEHKTFDKDCILTVFVGCDASGGIPAKLIHGLAVESGSCEPISEEGSMLLRSFTIPINATKSALVQVFPYRVTAGSVLTLTLTNQSQSSAYYAGIHYSVNGVGISES